MNASVNALPLTPDAQRGVDLARKFPDARCPGCGRTASQHPPGAWGPCLGCGRCIHRFGPGGVSRCVRCGPRAATTHESEMEGTTHG